MSAVALTNFGFGDQLVRVIGRDDQPWFVGNDVCAALHHGNPRQVLSRLEDDERDDVQIVDAIGREQQTTIISESGVYALIFTSRKPIAREFRKWVTSEVLPSLRKTGSYAMGDDKGGLAPGINTPKLGTPSERDAIRVAMMMIREIKDLYGQQAGRQMWVRLGFPLPDDIDPVPFPAAQEPMQPPSLRAMSTFGVWPKGCARAAGMRRTRARCTRVIFHGAPPYRPSRWGRSGSPG